MQDFEKLGFAMTSYFDHSKVLMSKLLSTGELSDVTIVSDDQVRIKAHKFMLMYYSSVFQNLFASDETRHSSDSILYLRGITYEELKPILEFIYNGQVVCHQKRIPIFLKVAKDLKIKEMNESLSEDKEGNLEVEVETNKENNEHFDTEIENKGINYADQSKHDQTTKIIEENDEAETEERKAEKKLFHCPECDSLFTNFSSMQEHYRIKHKNKKQQCNYCDYKTSSSSHLYRHVRSIHEQIQHFCDFCDYKVTRKDILNVHIRKHHSNQ